MILQLLAILRISEILVFERIFLPLREVVGILHDSDGLPLGVDDDVPLHFFGHMLSCVRCTSVWVTTGLVLITKFWKTGGTIISTIFALNKLALMLNNLLINLKLQ